jgi:hypothetical protein
VVKSREVNCQERTKKLPPPRLERRNSDIIFEYAPDDEQNTGIEDYDEEDDDSTTATFERNCLLLKLNRRWNVFRQTIAVFLPYTCGC